ncbi:hypothetical protein M408DRAFT_293981 [Serendipita vermifera MAFF 305830]|uniref:Uncharacterized protein n=1 Tax=Serendipita vermifera MAFF 305830 TaxID=933852 RepID=A0A0C3AS01_SERVB|nr:hypothetical protein M408DRAFT_293981 [Serendipita vermifera MAFF 305830]
MCCDDPVDWARNSHLAIWGVTTVMLALTLLVTNSLVSYILISSDHSIVFSSPTPFRTTRPLFLRFCFLLNLTSYLIIYHP